MFSKVSIGDISFKNVSVGIRNIILSSDTEPDDGFDIKIIPDSFTIEQGEKLYIPYTTELDLYYAVMELRVKDEVFSSTYNNGEVIECFTGDIPDGCYENVRACAVEWDSSISGYVPFAESKEFTVIVGNGTPGDRVPATGVILNFYEYYLNRGQQIQLIATVLPENATNNKVTWSATYPSVAGVTSDGLVTAYNGGYTPIVVRTDDGGFEYVCHINVRY